VSAFKTAGQIFFDPIYWTYNGTKRGGIVLFTQNIVKVKVNSVKTRKKTKLLISGVEKISKFQF
jgi:hypothetical protein